MAVYAAVALKTAKTLKTLSDTFKTTSSTTVGPVQHVPVGLAHLALNVTHFAFECRVPRLLNFLQDYVASAQGMANLPPACRAQIARDIHSYIQDSVVGGPLDSTTIYTSYTLGKGVVWVWKLDVSRIPDTREAVSISRTSFDAAFVANRAFVVITKSKANAFSSYSQQYIQYLEPAITREHQEMVIAAAQPFLNQFLLPAIAN